MCVIQKTPCGIVFMSDIRLSTVSVVNGTEATNLKDHQNAVGKTVQDSA